MYTFLDERFTMYNSIFFRYFRHLNVTISSLNVYPFIVKMYTNRLPAVFGGDNMNHFDSEENYEVLYLKITSFVNLFLSSLALSYLHHEKALTVINVILRIMRYFEHLYLYGYSMFEAHRTQKIMTVPWMFVKPKNCL